MTADTLTETAAARLRADILGGALPPGTRLPPERRLAEDLGVHRVTVRAALGRLVAAGLLQVRQGSGYTVRDWSQAAGPELLPGLLALDGDLRDRVADLLEVRRALARVVLERLVQRRPALDGIAAAVDAFAALVVADADPERVALADLDVLLALVAATDSPVLAVCLNPVAQVLCGTPTLQAALYRSPAENAAGWQALLSLLREPVPGGIELVLDLLAARDAVTLTSVEAP